MELAYLADVECNQHGKPAVNKLRVLEKVLLKLKTPLFANYFLNKGGLEQFNNFMKKLPDGSWPLSHVRTEILHCILHLPNNEHHLKYTKLGKTLTALLNSKNETEDNKRLILEIKEKWSRIVSGVKTEYLNLENFEKENHELMRKKKKRSTTQVQEFLLQNFVNDLNENITPDDLAATFKMGFNFTIRPYSNLTKRPTSKYEGTSAEEIDKHLNKIRKLTKLS